MVSELHTQCAFRAKFDEIMYLLVITHVDMSIEEVFDSTVNTFKEGEKDFYKFKCVFVILYNSLKNKSSNKRSGSRFEVFYL